MVTLVVGRCVVVFFQGVPDQPMCGFSNRAVQILDHHRAVYGAFDVLRDPEVREGIKKFS
jgi:monothiol glutaredoxin